MNEFARIAAFRSLAVDGAGVALGIGDDAAVLCPTPGRDLLVTQDALVEGVHFQRSWQPPRLLGRKALTVSLSDIAAMGGVPRFALLTLALPEDLPPAWAEEVVRGVVDRGLAHGVSLVGGDTVRSPGPVMVDLCLIGECRPGHAVGRGGARPGDYLAVTGSVGDAAAGLALMERPAPPELPAADRSRLRAALLDPPVRLAQGQRLAGKAHAMVDLSDGLAGAVQALCRASGVGARLEAERLPLSPALRRLATAWREDPVRLALSGGEDYELLCALPPGPEEAPPRLSGLTVVGRVTATPERLLVWPDGRTEPLGSGYDAFTPGEGGPAPGEGHG